MATHVLTEVSMLLEKPTMLTYQEIRWRINTMLQQMLSIDAQRTTFERGTRSY